MRYVVTRGGAETGLIVEALEPNGDWRYLQHLPEPVLLTEDDIETSAGPITPPHASPGTGMHWWSATAHRPTTRHGTRCWR